MTILKGLNTVFVEGALALALQAPVMPSQLPADVTIELARMKSAEPTAVLVPPGMPFTLRLASRPPGRMRVLIDHGGRIMQGELVPPSGSATNPAAPIAPPTL